MAFKLFSKFTAAIINTTTKISGFFKKPIPNPEIAFSVPSSSVSGQTAARVQSSVTYSAVDVPSVNYSGEAAAGLRSITHTMPFGHRRPQLSKFSRGAASYATQPGANLFECHLCGPEIPIHDRTFNTPERMGNHYRLCHKHICRRNHFCPICHAYFQTKKRLAEHKCPAKGYTTYDEVVNAHIRAAAKEQEQKALAEESKSAKKALGLKYVQIWLDSEQKKKDEEDKLMMELEIEELLEELLAADEKDEEDKLMMELEIEELLEELLAADEKDEVAVEAAAQEAGET